MSNSLDPDKTQSQSASHPDPSCLHMALWFGDKQGRGLAIVYNIGGIRGFLLDLNNDNWKCFGIVKPCSPRKACAFDQGLHG